MGKGQPDLQGFLFVSNRCKYREEKQYVTHQLTRLLLYFLQGVECICSRVIGDSLNLFLESKAFTQLGSNFLMPRRALMLGVLTPFPSPVTHGLFKPYVKNFLSCRSSAEASLPSKSELRAFLFM